MLLNLYFLTLVWLHSPLHQPTCDETLICITGHLMKFAVAGSVVQMQNLLLCSNGCALWPICVVGCTPMETNCGFQGYGRIE